MWYIISCDNPDHKYIILGGKTYTAGRKECDILVTGDATVSRKHAELSMTHADSNLTNPAKLPVLLLKDLSKFGTWVNSQQVEGDKILNDGDSVYFGSDKSSFMIVYEPLVVTSSCLEPPAKKSLRRTLAALGGHMVSEWTKDCSLLIMSKLSVTIKVICALVSLKPVVTPGYLEAYYKHLQGKADKPDPELFLPVVAESQLDPSEVTFATDDSRKTLFQGLTFVFLSQKQFKKMSLAIELAAGTPLLMAGSGELGLVTQPGTVVMAAPPDMDASLAGGGDGAWVARVQKALDKVGKHMIADAELGYAVLYCSTEKHCNPDYIPGDTSMMKLPSQTLSQADAFVADSLTQHRTQPGTSTQPRKSRQKSPVKPEPKSEPLTPATTSVSDHRPRGTRGGRTSGASPDNTAADSVGDSVTQKVTQPREKGQRAKSPMPAAPSPPTVVKVKKEVPSQPSASPASKPPAAASQSRKKRGRVIEEDSSDEDTVTVSKRIKTEPATPKGKPDTIKPSDTKASTAAAFNIDSVWDSDDDIDYSKIDIDESISAPNTRTSPRRSPRHSPSRTEPAEVEKKKNRSRSRSPRHSPRRPEPTVAEKKSRSRSPRHSPSRTEPTGVENKKSRSRSKSPLPPTKKPMVKTETVGFAVTAGEPEISNDKASRSDDSKSTGSRPSQSGAGVSRTKVTEEAGSSVGSRGKTKKKTVVEDSDEMLSEEEEDRRPRTLGHSAPAGFLTAVKAEKDKSGAGDAPSVKPEPGVEPDLPRGCGQVETVSLVFRRPKPKTGGAAGDCPEGYTRWKGKVIRNFKKFRKSSHAGANSLPKIIGGSDLEVHQGSRSKEVDEWMKDTMQAESQHTAEDKRAQAMFDFNPGSKRRGR